MPISRPSLKHNMRTGSLIQWQEPYNDDPSLIKDAGLGIVMKIKEHVYSPESSTGFCEELKYTVFDVYRNKFNDIITLSEDYISLKE
jgi:hypothetical protein